MWINTKNGKITQVPRHGSQEVPKGTLDNIFKELGL
ncbi:MAG: type II toxin-antitoxin system HicA family toxin [Prevotella sp.]|nr:type II toxin-antitoxin system HicA family toxin [Prevotella sp.]